MFRELDPRRIVSTTRVLRQRVDEHFPISDLHNVASELEAVARHAAQVSRWLGTSNMALRVATGVAFALFVAIMGIAFANLRTDTHLSNVSDLVPGLEPFINDVVFLGIAIYFLSTLEPRRKRNRAMSAWHELRATARIIDLHQLTKDPEPIVRGGPDTGSSPQRHMTPAELARYLDCCSGSAAIELENLTVRVPHNLGRKFVMLDRILEAEK